MKFRSDINGLRAFAVLAVILFHFGVPGAKGGFVGVDVFFVISGYLMTAIIFGKLEKQRFSLLDFYLSRARRIIPALATLCFFLILLGWFLLLPSEYVKMAKHASGSISFISNIMYWSEAGYFDVSSHEKWLLHTWSLSVEWQFYLIYPIGILFIRTCFSKYSVRFILAILAAFSLALSIYASQRWPGAAFYLIPTRAWEMLAGGMVFLFPYSIKKTYRAPLELLGILAILYSILSFSSNNLWPGWLALLPVAGTVIILISNRNESRFTNNLIAQFLGKISYSVYLWHWPIVVLLNYYSHSDKAEWVIIGIASSIAFGYLSYIFVENRLWFEIKNTSIVMKLGSYCVLSIFILSLGELVYASGGLPTTLRLSHSSIVADRAMNNRNPRSKECTAHPGATDSPKCIFGGDQKAVSIIVIGDSHSNATINAVADALPEKSGGALFLGADGCMSMLNLSNQFFTNCGDYNKKIMELLIKKYAGIPVLVINRTSSITMGENEESEQSWIYLDGLKRTDDEFLDKFKSSYVTNICRISKTHPVYIIKPIPEMDVNVPKSLMRNRKKSVYISMNEYNQRHHITMDVLKSSRNQCGAKLLYTEKFLCDQDKCMGTKNGRPLYYDSNHLNEYGNKLLIPMFKTIWE